MESRDPPLELKDLALYVNTKLALLSSYVVNCTCYLYFKVINVSFPGLHTEFDVNVLRSRWASRQPATPSRSNCSSSATL
jgi:hypothetical protein